MQPLENLGGIQKTVFARDSQGRVLEKAYYNRGGVLWEDSRGLALYRWEYDDTRSWVREYHFDALSQLTLDDEGVAIRKEIWLPQSLSHQGMNFGLAINPLYETLTPQQKLLEDRYLLKEDIQGVAVYRWTYDEKDHPVEEKTFDGDFALVEDAQGVSLYRRSYTSEGLLEEVAYFGNFSQAVENLEGLAKKRWDYDMAGQAVREYNFGLDGSLKEDKNGVATYDWKYNEKGLKIQQTNLGVFAQVKEDKNGVALYRWTYDKFGEVLEQTHFGMDGRPTEDITGAFLLKWETDEYGRRTPLRFDTQGNPLTGTSNPSGL